jgi:membrane-associated phospholipid phosphatase
MPPLYAQDPLSAVQAAAPWRWSDLPAALAHVASEAWVLALVALALYAFLEREVKDVVRVVLPLAVALAAAAGLAALGRALGAMPRPAGAGEGAAGVLRHVFPGGNVAAVAAFAAYSLLVYGRRARAAALLAVPVAVARALASAHWAVDLLAGTLEGCGLAGAAYFTAVWLSPGGPLARLGERRRGPGGSARASPPNA